MLTHKPKKNFSLGDAPRILLPPKISSLPGAIIKYKLQLIINHVCLLASKDSVRNTCVCSSNRLQSDLPS